MLIVPYGWDQPDNAVRVQRLGAGLHLARTEYSVETATTALKALLDTSRFSLRATAVGEQMATEDGLALACDAIDSVREYSDSLPQQRSSQRSSTPRIASDAP
ncbi:glycosyltransferase [Tunturiibacter psychrotolerans]